MNTMMVAQAPTPPLLVAAPAPVAEQNQGQHLCGMVNRLAIERVELSQSRLQQVMHQISEANSKRHVAVQLLQQIQQHTDGTGRINVANLDASVVQRARELFGDRLGRCTGQLNAEQTNQLRTQVESLDRQFGNLEVTDQMKLQQLMQNLQREVQLFTNLMERLHRISEMALNGIGGR